MIKTDFGAKEKTKESMHNARTAEKKPMTSKYGFNLEDVCSNRPLKDDQVANKHF